MGEAGGKLRYVVYKERSYSCTTVRNAGHLRFHAPLLSYLYYTKNLSTLQNKILSEER